MKFFIFRPDSDGTFFDIVTDKDVPGCMDSEKYGWKNPTLEEITIQNFQPTLPGIIVSLEEEYGYRYWIWETGMEAEALKDFFLNMNPMDYFYHEMSNLPGKVHRAECNAYGLITYDPDDYENIEKMRFFSTSGVVHAHLHTEDDSWLQIGDEYIEPLIKATLPPRDEE
jgi:hypothetical protein